MSKYIVENMLVSKIHVGQRRREKIGSLASLKSSLERVGQIHPITVRLNRDGFELVAGQRRLAAAEALGWKRVRVRLGSFSDEQLREIELDENAVRLDLTAFEASKAKLRQIEAAEAEARQDAAPDPRYAKKGNREAARRTGLDEKEVRRTKRHVAAAEEHPVFQGKDWKRSQVLAATEALERLPSRRDTALAIDIVSERGVPPKTAISIIENLAEKTASERKAIDALYRSDDPEKRSLAKTRAAKLPPMPDQRMTMTHEMLRMSRACIKLKNDGLTAAYEFVADEITKIIGELDEAYEKTKRGG